MRRLRIFLLSFFAFITAAAVAYRYVVLSDGSSQEQTGKVLNVVPSRPIAKVPLETLGGDKLDKEVFRGRWTVLTFGFTNCPVVCPTNMAYLKQEIEELGESAKDFTYVLVSVDPERDTPAAMKAYLAKYHPLLSGWRGTQEGVDAFVGFFGAYVARSKDTKGSMDIAHSPHYFVVNPKGEWVALYSLPMERGQLAKNLLAMKNQADSLL